MEGKESLSKQLEFYFSDSNYPKDNYLLRCAKENEGWIPVDVFTKCNKIKAITTDVNVISLNFRKLHDFVIVSDDGRFVRRKFPAPEPEVLDRRTVYAYNFNPHVLPSQSKIEDVFSQFGRVMSIWNLKGRKRKRGIFVEFENENQAKSCDDMETVYYADNGRQSSLQVMSKKKYVDDKDNRMRRGGRNNNNNRNIGGSNKRKAEEPIFNSNYTKQLLLKITNLNDIKKEEESEYEFRLFLKVNFEIYGKIEYIDFKEENICIIRFTETYGAVNALNALTQNQRKVRNTTLNAYIMIGEEEENYWHYKIFLKGGTNKKRKTNNWNNNDNNNEKEEST